MRAAISRKTRVGGAGRRADGADTHPHPSSTPLDERGLRFCQGRGLLFYVFEQVFEHGRISPTATWSSTPTSRWGTDGPRRRGEAPARAGTAAARLPPGSVRPVTGGWEVGEVTRVYGNSADGAAEVRRRDDEPEQFLWRDRLYLVRGVQGHWMESGGWWRTGVTRAALAAESGGRESGSGAAGLLDDREREFWRVEASAGRLDNLGVFDLCFDWSGGTWTVVRVQD